MRHKLALQRLVYYDMREQFDLSWQMTIRAISKVSEAYKRDKRCSRRFARMARWSMTSAFFRFRALIAHPS